MNNCAFCIQETGNLVNAVTVIAGTNCCRKHAKIELDKLQQQQQQQQQQRVQKAPPKAGDRLAKTAS